MTAAARLWWVVAFSYRPVPTPLLKRLEMLRACAPVTPGASPRPRVARTAMIDIAGSRRPAARPSTARACTKPPSRRSRGRLRARYRVNPIRPLAPMGRNEGHRVVADAIAGSDYRRMSKGVVRRASAGCRLTPGTAVSRSALLVAALVGEAALTPELAGSYDTCGISRRLGVDARRELWRCSSRSCSTARGPVLLSLLAVTVAGAILETPGAVLSFTATAPADHAGWQGGRYRGWGCAGANRWAMAAASRRSGASSFWRMCETWTLAF